MNPSRARNWLSQVIVAAALLPALPSRTTAHDVPATALVRAFIRPEGSKLRLLVRVPLEAMRDINWPVRGAGYVDFTAATPLLRDAAQMWIAGYVELYEGDTRLTGERIIAVRVSLPSDQSFATYQSALANLSAAPVETSAGIPWRQAMLDVLFEYDIASNHSRFSIRPQLAHLGVRTTTVLRFLPAGGTERAFEYIGDPGLVRLDPRWHQAALRFVRLGFDHILDGLDHFLFLLCLVIPFRQLRPLLVIVTSFTVAHSITLIASAAGIAPGALWFPPLIETLIALSIVYMAVENILGARLDRRWRVAFGFGLVHGFGFSFALRESLQFAGSHLLTSLLSFNVGVELGQVFVLLLAVPALNLLFKHVPERMGTIVLSALVAHTAWHWMSDRWSALRQYQFQWPAFDLALAGSAMRGLMLLLIIVGAAWLLRGLYQRFTYLLSARGPTSAP